MNQSSLQHQESVPVRIVLRHVMTTIAQCDAARPGDTARYIIAERWPALARHLATVQPFTNLELDTSGPVQTLAANGIRLASAWEPDAESLLQIAHLPTSNDAITLYGVGMGGLPELLLKRLSPGGTLTVVLMNASLFNTMLDVIEQSDWLQHSAIKLVLASEQTVVAPCRAITTPLLRLAEASAERLRDHLHQTLTECHTRQHLASREALTLANMAANQATVVADPDVAVLFAGHCRTAVVVAAGPSLDLSLNRIRALQAEGAQVVSVDAALQPLLNAGVKPDYIVTLDPQPFVIRFFEIDLAPLEQTSLVYFPLVDPIVIQSWPHNRYVAYTTHQRYDALRERAAHTSLFTSGSVIHPATDLAVRMGATTLYLAGADFGFPFDATHASSSAYCKPAPTTSMSGMTVTSYAGHKVPTMMNFISYYRDLEAFIGSRICRGCKFINLGQFSARIAGVSHEVVA